MRSQRPTADASFAAALESKGGSMMSCSFSCKLLRAAITRAKNSAEAWAIGSLFAGTTLRR